MAENGPVLGSATIYRWYAPSRNCNKIAPKIRCIAKWSIFGY